MDKSGRFLQKLMAVYILLMLLDDNAATFLAGTLMDERFIFIVGDLDV